MPGNCIAYRYQKTSNHISVIYLSKLYSHFKNPGVHRSTLVYTGSGKIKILVEKLHHSPNGLMPGNCIAYRYQKTSYHISVTYLSKLYSHFKNPGLHRSTLVYTRSGKIKILVGKLHHNPKVLYSPHSELNVVL